MDETPLAIGPDMRIVRKLRDLIRPVQHPARPDPFSGYDIFVADLLATKPIRQAMSEAVGDADRHQVAGRIECDILVWAGLTQGKMLIDFGCGSGRLAQVLAHTLDIEYLGLDVVQSLIDYASENGPPHYRFLLNRAWSLPCPDLSADFIAAFSIFTHLLPAESFIYLREFRRVIRPSGTVLFSFLELAEKTHWGDFEHEVTNCQSGRTNPVIMHLERPAIERWCEQLGYSVSFVDTNAAPWGAHPLGQTLAVLRPR